MPKQGIYLGTLSHRRFTPKSHRFELPLFMVMLDIDRIERTMEISRLTGMNRFNWASFDDRDHFGDPSLPLRERVERSAREHGVDLPPGPIYLLTHLRYLGYAFNPVSFFYCYDNDGQQAAILAEVNNTFGERRNYWLTGGDAIEAGRLRRYRALKALHVSPFLPMEMEYWFGFSEPGERLIVHMSTVERGEAVVDATLRLKFHEWNARQLRSALVRHPWMTMRVIFSIHWQALLLFLKRVPVYANPTGRSWKVW